MRSYVDETLAPARLVLLLAGVFAGTALLLAAVGLYGVTSYAVSQRTQEMGIRMALGASGRKIASLVVGQGLRLALLGMGLGLAGAAGLSQLLGAGLYQVEPIDPVTYGSIGVLLVGVAVLACWLPARRAARTEPSAALRQG